MGIGEIIIWFVIPGILGLVCLIGLFGRPGISTKPGPGLTGPMPGEPYGRWTATAKEWEENRKEQCN